MKAGTSAGEKRHRDKQERHTTQVPYSDLQHQRWGHAYIERLKAAQKHKLITGFTKEIKPCSVCDACKLAKLTYTTPSRTPGAENVRRDYGPLQKIVSDVKGPIHIVGIKGVRYYILYMDYCTKYKWIYFIKNLDAETILNTFKQFEYDITAIRGDLRIIEAFKRDNASYYEDKDVMQYMKTRGIHVQRTSPYTHHQGGLVERAHRTISEMAMTWIMASKAHKHLWPYAMRHAVYISNMLPTMALGSHAYNTLYRPMGNRSQWQSCQSMGMRYVCITLQRDTKEVRSRSKKSKASTLVKPNLC